VSGAASAPRASGPASAPRATSGPRATPGSSRPTPPAAGRGPSASPRHHLGFVLFSSALVGFLVVGLVSLNAFVAQSSFRLDDLQHRVETLSRRYVLLQKQAARLSSPGRIAGWADRHGMSFPADGQLHILHAPSGARSDVGRPSLPDGANPALKAIVEGGG
jgi:hypothetical protein